MQQAEDIRAAVLYVRTQLEREVTGLLGHSKGGLAAILYACKYDDVPKVVGLAPSFDRKAGLQEVKDALCGVNWCLYSVCHGTAASCQH